MRVRPGDALGRWPANVALDEAAAAALDEQNGDDSGSASRFFYCAKAQRSEREAGLVANNHPTVKPMALMRWLVRMVMPPGGTVLDPFAGSGSTLCAAELEGVAWIGIEQHARYCEIARGRIGHWKAVAAETVAPTEHIAAEHAGQMNLLEDV